MRLLAILGVAAMLLPAPVVAKTWSAGEMHRVVALASAAARRVDHKSELKVTIWYPAASGATETPDVIGKPDDPVFRIAMIAQDAKPAPGRHPVILFSHGFGGSAEIMGWLGAAFARAGYVVIGVDHPGNSDGDMSSVGSVAWWERPRDLIAALHAMEADPTIAPLLDAAHVGAAGYSMGGATALALGGATIDQKAFDAYCVANPGDFACQPPPEQSDTPHMSLEQGAHLLGLDNAAAHAGEGTALPGLRAVLSISPNARALSPASLARMHVPTAFVAGADDKVVPPVRHAGWAAKLVPSATLTLVPGAAHYSFLATCTDHGRAVSGACKAAPQQEAAHEAAIDAGLKLFARTLH